MATENKRQSTANKVSVALPKTTTDPSPSTAQMVPQEAALHAAIGSRVRISTSSPTQSTLEGTIYVADPTTSLLILNVSPTQNTSITPSNLHAPAGSYRIIPISQITTFQLQSLPPPSTSTSPPPPENASVNTLPTAALQSRLTSELTKARAATLRLGPKGTSPIEQALFDSLNRTMPSVWNGNRMIVSETYVIDKPYNPANVRLVAGASGDLDRMKKVLDFEKNKVMLKFSKSVIDGKMDGTGIGGGSAGKGSLKKGG